MLPDCKKRLPGCEVADQRHECGLDYLEDAGLKAFRPAMCARFEVTNGGAET